MEIANTGRGKQLLRRRPQVAEVNVLVLFRQRMHQRRGHTLNNVGAGGNGARLWRTRLDATGVVASEGETTVENGRPDLVVGPQPLEALMRRSAASSGNREIDLRPNLAGAARRQAVVPAIRRASRDCIARIKEEVEIMVNVLVTGEITEGPEVGIGARGATATIQIIDNAIGIRIHIEVDRRVCDTGLPFFGRRVGGIVLGASHAVEHDARNAAVLAGTVVALAPEETVRGAEEYLETCGERFTRLRPVAETAILRLGLHGHQLFGRLAKPGVENRIGLNRTTGVNHHGQTRRLEACKIDFGHEEFEEGENQVERHRTLKIRGVRLVDGSVTVSEQNFLLGHSGLTRIGEAILVRVVEDKVLHATEPLEDLDIAEVRVRRRRGADNNGQQAKYSSEVGVENSQLVVPRRNASDAEAAVVITGLNPDRLAGDITHVEIVQTHPAVGDGHAVVKIVVGGAGRMHGNDRATDRGRRITGARADVVHRLDVSELRVRTRNAKFLEEGRFVSLDPSIDGLLAFDGGRLLPMIPTGRNAVHAVFTRVDVLDHGIAFVIRQNDTHTQDVDDGITGRVRDEAAVGVLLVGRSKEVAENVHLDPRVAIINFAGETSHRRIAITHRLFAGQVVLVIERLVVLEHANGDLRRRNPTRGDTNRYSVFPKRNSCTTRRAARCTAPQGTVHVRHDRHEVSRVVGQ